MHVEFRSLGSVMILVELSVHLLDSFYTVILRPNTWKQGQSVQDLRPGQASGSYSKVHPCSRAAGLQALEDSRSQQVVGLAGGRRLECCCCSLLGHL